MSWARNRWLAVAFETALGCIFIWACRHKILDPPDFAKQILNYKITPGALINLTAIYLPWIELVAGIALIVGFWSRGATALVAGMLVIFIAALSFNLMRGHPVDCGCFAGTGGAPKTSAQLLSDMRWRIVEDVGMLAMAVWVLWIGPVSRPWLSGWSKAESAAA